MKIYNNARFKEKQQEVKEEHQEKLDSQKKESISKRDMQILQAAYQATGRPFDGKGRVKQAIKREQLLFYSGAKFADEHPQLSTKVAYMCIGAAAAITGFILSQIGILEGWL